MYEYNVEFVLEAMVIITSVSFDEPDLSDEFIKDREWQIEHNLFLDKFDIPAQISIKDEDGTDLFFARNKYEILDNYPEV